MVEINQETEEETGNETNQNTKENIKIEKNNQNLPSLTPRNAHPFLSLYIYTALFLHSFFLYTVIFQHVSFFPFRRPFIKRGSQVPAPRHATPRPGDTAANTFSFVPFRLHGNAGLC